MVHGVFAEGNRSSGVAKERDTACIDRPFYVFEAAMADLSLRHRTSLYSLGFPKPESNLLMKRFGRTQVGNE